MENQKCQKCNYTIAVRNCTDCLVFYCNECFKEDHLNKDHLSKDIKTNAYIKDGSYRLSNVSYEDVLLPSIPSFGSFDKVSTSVLSSDRAPLFDRDIIPNVPSSELLSFGSGLNDEDNFYTSTPISGSRAPLFETNIITNPPSPELLSSELGVDVDEKFHVVTFIGKPVNPTKPIANDLFLKNESYHFPGYSESTLIGRLACNNADKVVILNTENMYKGLEGKVVEQKNFLRLVLSLSDVIVFTATVPDNSDENRQCLKRDFLRLHDIMTVCKQEFSPFFSNINRKQPQKLAPGLIFLVGTSFHFKEGSLSLAIKDSTGRPALFESCSKILRCEDGKDSNEIFHKGLNEMLQDLSEYRCKHSLHEIWSCIAACQRSLAEAASGLFEPDIPKEWFRCRLSCAICQAVCTRFAGHEDAHENTDEICHESEKNKVFFCKKCCEEGSKRVVPQLTYKAMAREDGFMKAALWYPVRGRVIECGTHGVIGDNNWFSGYCADDCVVTNYVHEWPGSNLISQNTYPMSQIIIDKVSDISKPINKVMVNTANVLTDGLIIPNDWERTTSAFDCRRCQTQFTDTMHKHHCRNCKKVVCSSCFIDVRNLCKLCLDENHPILEDDPTSLRFFNMLKSFNVVSKYFKKTVTSITRPEYWEDDKNAIRCFICSETFDDEMRPIHHCRACGRCVCDPCSPHLRTVEWRDINEASRVCSQCNSNETWKKAP